jgi:proline dehydrogenase
MPSALNRFIVFMLGFMPKPVVRRFAGRYIAGDTLNDTIKLVKELNAQGMMATIDVLGEAITTLQEARFAVEEYKRCLTAIVEHKLDANISIKPTAFGMGLDDPTAEANIRELVAEAHRLGVFVRIDMEDSRYTSATYDLYLRLKKEFPKVGTVMQAYMRRSHADVKAMINQGINLRLCKGIYVEPREIAYKDPYLVNRNYALLLEELIKGGAYVGIATHDEKLVWEGLRVARQYQLGREQYEFQMLLGVDKQLRDIILKENNRLRIYVPYGTEWYLYCMRRLRENPQIAMHIITNLFKPG